ncbi:MAG: acyltransferase [candidate division WWE3 bacterium]|nr:acyltransferase [candidate division WWE3 bacterium]
MPFLTSSNPETQTIIFGGLFILLILALGFKKSADSLNLSLNKVSELKGLAILMVIFSHVGYFLVPDNRFLVPLSGFGGVAVNLFLVLSGLGLTISQLKNPLSPIEFYKKRLLKIYIPAWFALGIIIIAERLFLNLSYSTNEIVSSFSGFFPKANLYANLDSPFWYFTFLLIFYLIFPWVMKIKVKVLAPFITLLIIFLLLIINWPSSFEVLGLYKIHFIAFPLGMLLATLAQTSLKNWTAKIFSSIYLKVLLAIASASIFVYFAVHSNVGNPATYLEQFSSLGTVIGILGLFFVINFESRFLKIFGEYSYETFLLHWPIMLRFDFLYKTLPTGLATFIYIPFLLGVSSLFRRLVDFIVPKISAVTDALTKHKIKG